MGYLEWFKLIEEKLEMIAKFGNTETTSLLGPIECDVALGPKIERDAAPRHRDGRPSVAPLLLIASH